MTQWQLTLSMAKFNAKHVATFSDKSAAKHAAMKAVKEGIWVVGKGMSETYWAPASIAKLHIEMLEGEQT